MPTPASAAHDTETNVVETIQSLIVAFVLAMTFRGFVTEGFVIPTGSMAPTLLGQHALIHSEVSGYEFPIGLDPNQTQPANANRIADPMLGPYFPGSGVPAIKRPNGMGDRILVLKTLYPFAEPHRFDVVVFKNPTDPNGDAANYIKRLIGLPNEQVWLADGDVFARKVRSETARNPVAGPLDLGSFDFGPWSIQRKPQHVQRAVWQTVYNSDFAILQPLKLDRRYEGPPWEGDPSAWDTTGRSYRSTGAAPATLMWDESRRAVNDWTPYNMLAGIPAFVPVSDIRVSAAIVADRSGLKTTFELEARSHVFQFIIDSSGSNGSATAILRMRPQNDSGESSDWVQTPPANIDLPAPGKVFNVEFWHADQAMRLFINGKQVIDPLEYDWSPVQRLQFATGQLDNENLEALLNRSPLPPKIRWTFEGSSVTLYRVRLDRDLHYRYDMLDPNRQQRNAPHIFGHAFGTHPTDNPAILGPDQFMMCGDNSQMSLDSRLWGSPHPLVASQIDDHPFTVNRKLLVGKAWVVYFPAPYSMSPGGLSFIPDFGRLRFIR